MSFITNAIAKMRAELDQITGDGTEVAVKVDTAFASGVKHAFLAAIAADATNLEDKLKAAFDLGASSTT